MKIRLVITNAPPLVGGLEKACLRMAQHLQRQGHEVQILGRFTQGPHRLAGFFADTEEARTLDCQGVTVKVLALDAKARFLLWPVFKLIWRKWTFPLARWLYVAAMRPQIAEAIRGVDVVHYFGVGREMLGFAALAAAKEVEAAFVVNPAIHGGKWGDSWIDEIFFRRVDLMLCYSAEEGTIIERMGVTPRRILKVPCGFDFCDSGDGEQFRKNYKITGPMVLFLGRKTLEKGVGRLLEAWPMVAEKFPEATLVFAGPRSPNFEKLKAESGNFETTKYTTPARQRIAQGEVEGVGWEPTGAKRSELHERGEEVVTTDDTDGHGYQKSQQDDAQGTCAGAAFSNPFTSELARDSENSSLTRSASSPAGAQIAPEDGRSEIVEKEFGSDGGNQLEDSREFLEGQSQAGLQMDSQKLQSIRAANDTSASGQNSSSVLIREIRGSNFAALDAGRSTLDTAPKALNLDDLTEGEKQDALAACDLLCVPSEGESFGMVYFEAWAYGKPVVALDLPVLRETVGAADAGILVKDAPTNLAEGINALIGDSTLRKRMGENGKQLAILHRWEQIISHSLQGYEKAIKEKRL